MSEGSYPGTRGAQFSYMPMHGQDIIAGLSPETKNASEMMEWTVAHLRGSEATDAVRADRVVTPADVPGLTLCCLSPLECFDRLPHCT